MNDETSGSNGTDTADRNGSKVSPDTVPLSEAAERLGVTLPRLQRLLRRAEFAPHVSKGERRTRTGTRTVTLVSVSVLPDLRSTIEGQKHEQNGANRYRSEGGEASAREGEASGPLVRAVIAQMEQRLADKDAEIARLAKLLDDANERQRMTLAALGQEQQLRALATPSPVQEPAPEQTGPERHAGGPTAGDGGPEAAEAQPRPGGASEGERPRQAWWQVWRRKDGHD